MKNPDTHFSNLEFHPITVKTLFCKKKKQFVTTIMALID